MYSILVSTDVLCGELRVPTFVMEAASLAPAFPVNCGVSFDECC